MTVYADFTEEEWKTVLEGAPSGGRRVMSVVHGGTFRAPFVVGKAYGEACPRHGESERLAEIIPPEPKIDRTRRHSAEGGKERGLKHLRDVVDVRKCKTAVDELCDYRGFVLALAGRVAQAHGVQEVAVREQGDSGGHSL